MVGYYGASGNHSHGFTYDGTTWTALDVSGAYSTLPLDIDGDNIVGTYSDPYGNIMHGFLYNKGTWTTLDMPGALWTCIYGISGNTLVGMYHDASYTEHGFIYTIPEPATLLLLGLGGLLLRKKR